MASLNHAQSFVISRKPVPSYILTESLENLCSQYADLDQMTFRSTRPPSIQDMSVEAHPLWKNRNSLPHSLRDQRSTYPGKPLCLSSLIAECHHYAQALSSTSGSVYTNNSSPTDSVFPPSTPESQSPYREFDSSTIWSHPDDDEFYSELQFSPLFAAECTSIVEQNVKRRTPSLYSRRSAMSKRSVHVDKVLPPVPPLPPLPNLNSIPLTSDDLSFDEFWAQGRDESEERVAQASSKSRSNTPGSRQDPCLSSDKVLPTQNRDTTTLDVDLSPVVSSSDSESATHPLANLPIAPFDEHALPTWDQLQHASSLSVISESGVRVPFGTLWQDQKTVVIFIRHFLSPSCQEYMSSISQTVGFETLRQQGVKLVVVSNGHFGLIKYYRKIFQTPFDVYTDPTHEIYNALGMTLRLGSNDKGAGPRPAYMRHGRVRRLGSVIAKAIRVGMPIWRNCGNKNQLGGEFVLGPGLQCRFAHRMPFSRAHLNIEELMEKAGVDLGEGIGRRHCLRDTK
ncbi:hypothetical protein VNI00_000396 [Paramarasmius palmivorus]|uniref:Thioredoxin-like protein AAED1 n=1 Tax=Paramarasmius palmivorus TaxID=297713 RepID=A0AAW0EEI3_9AGAR